MLQVKHLLAEKGNQVHAIGPDDPVLAAVQAMADRYIGALLVMHGDDLVGIVSERDYARKIVLKGRSSSATPVRDIMTSPVISVSPSDSVDTCMRLCTDSRVRHLPVVEGGKVRFKVLTKGKPLAKAEVSVTADGKESVKRTTDDAGLTPATEGSGRYAAYVRHTSETPGEIDGKKYDVLADYATLVVDVK